VAKFNMFLSAVLPYLSLLPVAYSACRGFCNVEVCAVAVDILLMLPPSVIKDWCATTADSMAASRWCHFGDVLYSSVERV